MTPEQGKLLSSVFIGTIQNETETTKKVIRAVPEDKKNYKPDAKSMSNRSIRTMSRIESLASMTLRGRFS